jgi:tetratricopeptide (TPR) repeat protein
MVLLAALISGCSSFPDVVRHLPAEARSIELRNTPFFPQDRYQCGPAALATVLASSGVDTSVDDLVARVYLPGRKGSLQVELLAATRTSGRIAYVIDGTLANLYAELARARPVLVLQNLGVSAFPTWHYAVVVGIDSDAGQVVLRSGTEERRVTSIRTFLHTWRRSNYWAMIALRPGELPVNVERLPYLAAAAAFEQAGHDAGTTSIWLAARDRWPKDSLVLLGLANAHYASQEYAAAKAVLRDLLNIDTDNHIARNNLAMVYIHEKNFDAALQQVDRALRTVEDSAVKAELLRTRETALAELESSAHD